MKKVKMRGVIMLTFGLIILSGCGESKNMSAEEFSVEMLKINLAEENGIITSEEAKKKITQLYKNSSSIETNKREKENVSNFTEIPAWAIEIGINEPKDFAIIQGESYIIKNNGIQPDSFTAIYFGDKGVAMREAKKIAKILNIEPEIDDGEKFRVVGDFGDRFQINISAYQQKLQLSIINLKQLSENTKNITK